PSDLGALRRDLPPADPRLSGHAAPDQGLDGGVAILLQGRRGDVREPGSARDRRLQHPPRPRAGLESQSASSMAGIFVKALGTAPATHTWWPRISNSPPAV